MLIRIFVCKICTENTLDINSQIIKTVREKNKDCKLGGYRQSWKTWEARTSLKILKFVNTYEILYKKFLELKAITSKLDQAEYFEGTKGITEFYTDYVEECKKRIFRMTMLATTQCFTEFSRQSSISVF